MLFQDKQTFRPDDFLSKPKANNGLGNPGNTVVVKTIFLDLSSYSEYHRYKYRLENCSRIGY